MSEMDRMSYDSDYVWLALASDAETADFARAVRTACIRERTLPISLVAQRTLGVARVVSLATLSNNLGYGLLRESQRAPWMHWETDPISLAEARSALARAPAMFGVRSRKRIDALKRLAARSRSALRTRARAAFSLARQLDPDRGTGALNLPLVLVAERRYLEAANAWERIARAHRPEMVTGIAEANAVFAFTAAGQFGKALQIGSLVDGSAKGPSAALLALNRAVLALTLGEAFMFETALYRAAELATATQHAEHVIARIRDLRVDLARSLAAQPRLATALSRFLRQVPGPITPIAGVS